MRSKVARKILESTPEDVRVFAGMYGDIVVRVHDLISEKGYTQKQLAKRMDKKPSEISKWLNGEHNFTLRTLAKLEVELGEPIICVPKRKMFKPLKGGFHTVYSNVGFKVRSEFGKVKSIDQGDSHLQQIA